MLPTCAENPLACDLDQKRYQTILDKTVHSKDRQSLYIRGLAARQLAADRFNQLRALPESPELHRFQSTLYRYQAKYGESTEEMRSALKLAPHDKAVQEEYGAALFLEQKFQANLPELMKLQSENPASAKLNFFTGHSLLETQQVAESLPYLQKALLLDPHLVVAHLSLGLSLARLGKFNECISHLKIALPLDQDGSLYYQLSRAYQATGSPDLAKQAMEEYQRRSKPNSPVR